MTDEQAQARKAREDAEEQLHSVVSRWPAVLATIEPLRVLRTSNHFADQALAAFSRRRK